ncbi:MAG: diguanylate cyclase [Chlorobi bacterium]|nr:diguanylate cyclase [Chlorobiota bacterium]
MILTKAFFITVVLFSLLSFTKEDNLVYKIKKIDKDIKIDADWNKDVWKNVDAVQLKNYMGTKPEHFPTVYAKLVYTDSDIYVIFKVIDQYVKSAAKKYQGKVYEDSCVEFFFTPDDNTKKGYFNLESNCGGVQLFRYNALDKKKRIPIKYKDYQEVTVAHSLPKINDPEIKKKITWYLEYKIPFDLIAKYYKMDKPKSGTEWKANFYKCADKTSHPHWLTWNKVDYPKPNFHLSQFFGTLIFE